MSRRVTPHALALLALATVLLSACDPLPPADPGTGTPTTAPSASQASGSLLGPLPEDAVLGIAVIVTDASGAALQLREIVHRSYAWDSDEGRPLAGMMTAGCLGALEDTVYEEQLWSFASIEVSATPVGDTPWAGDPADTARWIRVQPLTAHLSLASDGVLVEDPAAVPEAPHCDRDRLIAGTGTGALVVGFHGDTDAVGAAGHFTRWANHRYGFQADDPGLVFSGCETVVTELGASLGGGVASWTSELDGTHCVTGSGLPEDTDS